jgi:hypothetical protein
MRPVVLAHPEVVVLAPVVALRAVHRAAVQVQVEMAPAETAAMAEVRYRTSTLSMKSMNCFAEDAEIAGASGVVDSGLGLINLHSN